MAKEKKRSEPNVGNNARRRNWCSTNVHNPVPKARRDPRVQYIVSGEEIAPSTGKVHWQTYVQFKEPISRTQWQAICKEKCHCAPQWAMNNSQPEMYCKKDGAFEEYGTPKEQGKRNDWPTRAQLAACKTWEDVKDIVPAGNIIRYRSGLMKAWQDERKLILKNRVLSKYEDQNLRPWQKWLLDNIPEDRRKVTWVWEPDGAVGKSWFTTYMQLKHNALPLTETNRANCAYQYEDQEYVIFDLTRNDFDPNWNTIEMFTNDTLSSGKYESEPKFCVAKVLVFSNKPPRMHKEDGSPTLSIDRWNIIDLAVQINSMEPLKICTEVTG